MRILTWQGLALLAVTAAMVVTPGGQGMVLAEEAAAAAPTTDAISDVPPQDAEKFPFEAEVHRMLDIVVNSLYQNKDVFLRELISNASDALDKIRYLLLTQADKYKPAEDIPLEVKIEYDSEQQTLTIRDTGIGMTKEEMIKNLGTVARSGTTKFLEAIKDGGSDLSAISQIGQFGVGFYSTFLVSDRVKVASKHPLDDTQHVWESNSGSGDFTVYKDPRGNTLDRGTEITLYLKEDCVEYADGNRLRELAKHYSEFITHPISLRTVTTMQVPVEEEDDEDDKEPKADGEDELEVGDELDDAEEDEPEMKEVTTYGWDRLNGNQAIWTRERDNITDDEYRNFWHVVSGDEDNNCTTWVHFVAEGNVNFKTLLYLPEEIPANMRIGAMEADDSGVRLYVRKVLISDKFDLMPRYLSFVKGVVDSDDMPLNVNRETLQESKILQVIKKKLVRKAIEMIRTFSKTEDDEPEPTSEEDKVEEEKKENKETKFDKWYKKFSPYLKVGAIEDEPNRGKLMKLLKFRTTKSKGKLITLDDYVDNMKKWQTEIYVIGGTSIEEMEKSPFLEPFHEKDIEVVYLDEAVDEYVVKQVKDYERKKFVHVSADNVKFKDEDEDLIKRRENAYKDKFGPLTKWLRKLYDRTVLRVQVAKRHLGSVPAIVTSSDFGNSANMERILKAQAFQHGVDPNSMRSLRVFEINPRHPIILKLLEGCPPEKEDEGAEPFTPSQETIDAAWMLHDMAMLNGGFPIADTDAHNKRMLRVLQSQFGLETLKLEPEIDVDLDADLPPEIKIDADLSGLNGQDFMKQDIDIDDLDLDLDGKDIKDIDPEELEKAADRAEAKKAKAAEDAQADDEL